MKLKSTFILSFLLILPLCFIKADLSKASSGGGDYFTHFASQAEIPDFGLSLKLPKRDEFSVIHTNYIEGDYAAVVKNGYNGSLNQTDDYLYFQALGHLKEWKRIFSEIMQSRYFNNDFLKAFYYKLFLESAIRTNNNTQALNFYKRFKKALTAFVPYNQVSDLVDELAANMNQISLASTQGGFYFYRYQNTKKQTDFVKSVKHYYPQALNMLPVNSYQTYLKVNDPKLKEYAQKSYIPLYISMLKKNKEYTKLGEYYFKKGQYGSAASTSPRGSFYYHMARLMMKSSKIDATGDISYAKKNLSKAAYYLSTYYFNKDDYKGVLDVFNQKYSQGSLRYLIVLGLDKKQYQSIYKALENHYKAGTKIPQMEKSAFYYWFAYLNKKLGQTKDAQQLFIKAAVDHPYSYYGWESFKALENRYDESLVMNQWKREYQRYKNGYNEYLSTLKSHKLPLRNDNVKKALFFFSVRENLRALQYLRTFLNSVPNKKAYYDDLIREFYKISRMDYYIAYNRYLFQEVDRLSGNKNLFFKDLMVLNLPLLYEKAIKQSAKEFKVEESSLQSLILQESNYDYLAVSWVGAQGLAQLMPATAAPIFKTLLKKKIIHNNNVFDPHTNIMLGGYYFGWLYNTVYKSYPLNDRVVLSYASYNAGPGRIKKMYHNLNNRENTPHFIESISLLESRNYSKILLLKRDLYKYFRGIN